METSSKLALWLAVWMATAAVVVWSRRKRELVGAGLVQAYLLNFWINHWIAASLYILPWYGYYNLNLIAEGFEQSVYGVLAFAFGSLILTPVVMKFCRFIEDRAVVYELHHDLPKAYMALGA